MISKIVIETRDFSDNSIKNKIIDYIKSFDIINYKAVAIFDIHNTTEYDNGKIDHNICSIIKKLTENNISVIFLSYDGQIDRIHQNENILNQHSDLMKTIPKIFIKKRDKGLIIKIISDYLNGNKKILFVDDKRANIESTKLNNPDNDNIICFRYKQHTHHKQNNITELQNIIDKI
jgi:rhodanese-related sulfurtransferase